MDNQVKYPIFKTFAKPFWDVGDHLKIFCKYSAIVAFLMGCSAVIFRQTFLCTFLGLYPQISCTNDVIMYLVYFFVKLLILSAFLRIWYDKIYLKKQINMQYIKQNIIRFLTFFLGLIAFLGLNLLPLLSLSLLIKRVPNPVWQAEIGYFTVVSLGFVVPFVMLRFYANLAELIEGENFKNFKSVAQKTADGFARILFSFALVVVSVLAVFLVVVGNLRAHIGGNIHLYNLFAEFVFEWAFVLVATLIINFIRVQKEVFTD